MILAEKITALRKQNAWSQEELADKLGISRQSISKWELGTSVPEPDKIVRLSEIFGISTDCLLKDGLDLNGETVPCAGDETDGGDEECAYAITHDEAISFMEITKKISGRIATGVSMCIISPVFLILLGAMADEKRISEAAAGGFGMTALLVIVACAVAIFVFNGISLGKYRFMEKSRVSIDGKTREAVKAKKAEYSPAFAIYITLGVALCIFGAIPVTVVSAAGIDGLSAAGAVGILLVMVAIAVNLFVRSSMISGSYDKLLEEGDYTPEKKRREKAAEVFAGIYWCAVTAIYLAVSFISRSWDSSWIIWPVAGVLFGALRLTFDAVENRKMKR